MRVLRAVQGVAYATKGRYANPLRFAKYVCADSVAEVETKEDFLGFLRARRDYFCRLAQLRPVTNESALALLACRDMDRMIETAEGHVSDSDLCETSVGVAFDKAKSVFVAHGLSLGDATVRVQDTFPEPYQHMDFWAMSYATGDQDGYDIGPGVVLNREYLMPLYTPALMAHELTHTALGQVGDNYLARGFEEGLAELFGTLFVGGEILSPHICEAILINSRLKYPQPKFWSMYTESIRQACVVTLREGWEGILKLIQQGNTEGRVRIKEAERTLLLQTRQYPIDRYIPDNRMTKFAEKFLSFPQSLVVSPLGMFLAEQLRQGMLVDELLATYQVDREAAEQALYELQQRVYLAVIHDGQVAADETKTFLETNTLRYETATF